MRSCIVANAGVCKRTKTDNQIESSNLSGSLEDESSLNRELLLSPVLILFQERHNTQVKELKQELLRHSENSLKLDNVNRLQKEQLEVAEETNQQLSKDIQRLTDQWDQFNRELKYKESLVVEGDESKTTHEKVGFLWKEILDFRRQMIHMKMSTERDLVTMKSEMTSTGRKVTSACVDVWSNTGNAQDSVSVQLEKCKLDRKSLENKLETLKNEVLAYQKKNHALEESLRHEKQNVEDISEKYDKVAQKATIQEEELVRLHDASKRNMQLENSLQDIAYLVEEEVEDEVDLAYTSVSFAQDASSIPLKRPQSSRRRTRSASPAITETTVASVQAALHKKQLQVHDLKNRLISHNTKIEANQKSLKSKDELLQNTLKELDKEKLQADSLKIKLDEAIREKNSVQDRIEVYSTEKSKIERQRDQLQEDLAGIMKEKSILNEAHSRIMQELKTARNDISRLETNNQTLNKDNKEKINLICQLESVGSSLREDLLNSKEELKRITGKFDIYKTEKSKELHEMSSANLDSSDLDERLILAKRREEDLENTVNNLEKAQNTLKNNNQRLENSVKKLNDEKLKLNIEINESKTYSQSLKDQVSNHERRLAQFESEKIAIEEQFKANESLRENLEIDLKKATSQREHLDNHLTSLTLQKEALHDEVIHMRAEVDELKNQLNRISGMNALMNKDKNELGIRSETLTKDVERLQRQVSSLINEKSQLMAQNDDIQEELNESESSISRWKTDHDRLETQNETLNKQLKNLKISMEDEIARAEAEKSQLEEERDQIRDR